MLVPCDGGIFDSLTTTSAMIGKFFMSGAYCIAYQWTAELFPTPCRSNGIAFGSMIGKIATTFTPAVMYLAVVAEWLPGLIFGAIAIIGGLIALSMPETLGVPSLQTYEQADNLYKGNKIFYTMA